MNGQYGLFKQWPIKCPFKIFLRILKAIHNCKPQIYTRDTRLPIPHVKWRRQPWGSIWGSSGFFPTTHAKANAKQMCSRSSCADCLHAQTTVHAGNLRTWWTTIILITGKTRRPQIESHAGIKMAQGLVSLVYICAVSLYVAFICSQWKLPNIPSSLIQLLYHVWKKKCPWQRTGSTVTASYVKFQIWESIWTGLLKHVF